MVRGIVCMIVAMMLIPMVDATAKWLSATHSPWFLGWVRYAGASLFVLPIALRVHGTAMLPSRNLPFHGLRTLFLVIAMTLYFLAISQIPLSTAVAAYFIGPVLAVAIACSFLKEPLNWSKATSIILGFGGAIVVLNPAGAVDAGVVLALGSGAFFALYLVSTRRAAQEDAELKALVFQCLVGTVLLTPQAIVHWSWPSLPELGLFLFMGLISAISHFFTISAFKYAEASVLAPFVYVELISAVCLGFFLFGEIPGLMTILGGGMIVFAGLLLIARRQA